MATATGKALANLWKNMTVKTPPGPTPVSADPQFNPMMTQYMRPIPTYVDHLRTLYEDRQIMDSRDLLQSMMLNDPDVSAAVGGYLTMADTPISIVVRDPKTLEIDANLTAQCMQYVSALFTITDYSKGFTFKSSLPLFCQELRRMLLMRGAVGSELVFNARLVPERMQHVDTKSVYWFEPKSGVYKPAQRIPGTFGTEMGMVPLDIPSFFLVHHRRDPTAIYPTSEFVSVINTAAARQEVINDLYRILNATGYPRIAIKVIEETLRKNAPTNIREDPNLLNSWAQGQLQQISDLFAGLRSDQPFTFFDSVDPSVINDKNPGVAVDISKVIDVLNAQNQAALKTMATVIGRGSAGVNTASVEARIAAMNADQLNVPLVQLLSQAFTYMLNCYGIAGLVQVGFAPAELRPATELEPMLALKAARLRADLSLGLISDTEYTMAMYQRLPLSTQPPLSGTGFMPGSTTQTDTEVVSPVDPGDVTPNADPLGRSLTPAK